MSEAEAEYRRAYLNQPSPFAKASWWNHVSFDWLNPSIDIATKADFKQDMHYDLRPSDKSANVVKELEGHWRESYPVPVLQKGQTTPIAGFLLAIWKTFKWSIGLGTLAQVTLVVVEFYSAYLIF